MHSADSGVTKPAAGVIATSPPTRPEHSPSSVALPRTTYSASDQARAPALAAMWVTASASAARLSPASDEPALKPNQPIHSSAAPIMVKARL